MDMVVDYHTHSTYSDGSMLYRMIVAAEDAGLDAIGFADHCNVSNRDQMIAKKEQLGFNLDQTYERRRNAIERFRDRFDIAIFDAVEMDYHPKDEEAIAPFLDQSEFDYVVGSVHYIDGINVHNRAHFADMPQEAKEEAVDTYFAYLIDMIESDLVDIVAHPDVIERNPGMRGIATEEHYEQVADALQSANCVPEINAGRLLSEYGRPHPTPVFLEVLLKQDISFTFGTDSHTPEGLREAVPALKQVFSEYSLEPHALNL